MKRLICLASAVLTGCAPLKAPLRPVEPSAVDHGGVVISVTVYEGLFQKYHARWVKLCRVRPDSTIDDQAISSNFSADDNIYVLDLPPGVYVPVSAVYQSMGSKHQVPFEAAVSKKAQIVVPSGELVFAGAFDFKRKKEGWRKKTVFVKRDSGKEAEILALAAAKAHLAGTLWSETLAKRAALLGPSRAPVLGPRNKVIAAVPTERFTYTDTLKWGEPRRVPGGLEWRQKEDRARIAVTFLSPGMKGYRNKDAYLQYLRSVGSPEDTHIVTEVALSSRTAYTARYTTYYYPEGTLVGSQVKVFLTETTMIPASEGVYLFHYRAQDKDFKKFYPLFKSFIGHVILPDIIP